MQLSTAKVIAIEKYRDIAAKAALEAIKKELPEEMRVYRVYKEALEEAICIAENTRL